MAIASLDQYIAAAKQRVTYMKTGARTTVAAFPFSLFDLAGNPGAGSLSPGNTAAGIVPTDATAGHPVITVFGASALGYITKVEFANTVACWFDLYDRLFVAGAYAFNAATTLAAQPSYAARVPNADYNGLQIWVEQVTGATGNQAVSVNYTNQAGATGHTTGATGIGAAPTVGRTWQLPLQAGDSGVQKIESVTGSVASAGTFNVMVLRPLWSGRVQIANGGDVHELLRTGMPQVYDTSALFVQLAADATASGIPEIQIEIANA